MIQISAVFMLPVSARQANDLPFLNSLFTATSAICVTGLVVVDTLTIELFRER
jgi:trk system potassium uptake protein TrkH